MASRFFNPVPQFVDQNGDPLVSGTLTFYYTGTSALKDTYADEAATIPNANPITLNSVGASPVEIWLDDEYRIVLKNASTTVVWDRDPVSGTAGGGGSGTVTVIETYADLIAFTTAADNEVVEMLGYYAAGDGGGGRFYWNAASTATANAGTIVQATATATGRFIALYENSLNDKRFGLKGNGAVDDSARFNASANAFVGVNGSNADFYLPASIYEASSTINFSNLVDFKLEGAGYQPGGITSGSVITGSIVGDLLKYVPAGTGNACHISDLAIANTSANAAAVSLHLEDIVTGSIHDCSINAAGGYGIYARNNIFTLGIFGCSLSGNYTLYPSAIGAYSPSHTHYFSVDVTGHNEGIRIGGIGSNIIGARVEVNVLGINLGVDDAGVSANSQGCNISGMTFEANDTAIKVSASTSHVGELTIQGSVNAPSGQSEVGMLVSGGDATEIANVNIAGGFNQAAMRAIPGSSGRISFRNVRTANSFTGRDWDVQGGLTNFDFENTDYQKRPDDTLVGQKIIDVIELSSLAQVDYLNPNARGKNLRGINVPITATHTTLAVAFTTAHGAGVAAINTATAGAVAGTLPAGTYYYLATAVTAHGEGSGTSEKTVTIGGANNGTTVVFFAMTADGFKRRIYRGTASGIYDGYYETALNSNSNFVDTNAAFDGIKQPPTVGVDDTAMVEPDANYAVQITPNFNMGAPPWVTAKATTGFTVNWTTAAPANSTLDWFVVR